MSPLRRSRGLPRVPRVAAPLLLVAGCGLARNGLGPVVDDASAPEPARDAAASDDVPLATDSRSGEGSSSGAIDASSNPGVDASVDSGPPPPPNAMPGWKWRRALTIDNGKYAALTHVPVLAKLDATRIDYAKVQPMGQDVRFVDDTGTVLPYEIEAFGAPLSWAWFAVPTLPAHATAVVWMYYGNPSAPDAQQPSAVWDSSYVGVWHLRDATDSTGGSTSTNAGATSVATGAVGPAMHFDGSSQFVNTGYGGQLPTWTVEAWENADAAPTTTAGWAGPLMHDEDFGIGWGCNQPFWPSSAQSISVQIAGSACNQGWCTAQFASAGTAQALQPGAWHQLVATYDGQTLAAFTDGALHDSAALTGVPAMANHNAHIGSNEYETAFFGGQVDEVRISKSVRSADWIGAQYRSMTDAYVTYGPEQPNP